MHRDDATYVELQRKAFDLQQKQRALRRIESDRPQSGTPNRREMQQSLRRIVTDKPKDGLPSPLRQSHLGGAIADSPMAMSQLEAPSGSATPSKGLNGSAQLDDGKKDFKRTVTINEPEQNPEEDDTPLSQSTPLKPSKPLSRFSTFVSSRSARSNQSFRSFTSVVADAWQHRHDPDHEGFWSWLWLWTVDLWQALIGSKEASKEDVREGDPDYIPPKYRWTPILSGLLQPFSILLEIPGLTEHWYVSQDGSTYQENPAWLDVALAISMLCAVVANIALISRFMERRVYWSTMTTIVALTVHDVLNISVITVFGVIHRFNDGYIYAQSFWMCVCSTVASAFTNASLIYDLIKTKQFDKSGSGLTPKQRSLVIIVMIFLVYLAFGALVFNFLLPDIAFQNCLYFTVVTIETIGFGDVLPDTLGAQIFLFFYAPFGILNLAVMVGTARDTLVESWNTAYRRRRHEIIRRHRERKQQRADETVRRAAIERQLELVGAPKYVHGWGGGLRGGSRKKSLNVRALSQDQLSQAEAEAVNEIANRAGSTSAGSRRMTGLDLVDPQYEKALADARRMQDELTAQSLMTEEGYREFQDRMSKEERMESWVKVRDLISITY